MTEISNITGEQVLLGALLLNHNQTSRVMAFVRQEHFAEPVHQRIYAKCVSELSAGRSISPVLLGNAFTLDGSLATIGGGEYLARLASLAVTVLSALDYARQIYDLAKKREMLAVFEAATNEIKCGSDVSADEIASTVSGELSKLAHNEASNPMLSSRQVSMEIYEDMKQQRPCYATGIQALDEAMQGGLYVGKSYGVAARMKQGKTMLAGSISYNLNHAGVKHLFICAEMGRKEIHQRNVARAVKRNCLSFVKAERDTHDFQESVAYYAKHEPNNIYYLDASSLSFETLKRNVANAVMRYQITGFILDYWQLVKGKSRDGSQTDHLDQVAQWISDYCRQESLWSLTMAQINRDGQMRGGDGMKLAFDQTYDLNRIEGSPLGYMTQTANRYSIFRDVGSENLPALEIDNHGPHFRDK